MGVEIGEFKEFHARYQNQRSQIFAWFLYLSDNAFLEVIKFVLEDKSLIDELARGAGVWTYYYVGLKKPTAENPVGEAKRLFMIPFDALPGILVFAKARHLKRCPCVFFPLDPCYRRRPPFQNRLRPGPCDWSRVLNKRPALSRCPGWSSPGARSECGS